MRCETAGVCFGAGLMELGSADLVLSCLWMNSKKYYIGVVHYHLLMKSLVTWFLEYAVICYMLV